MKRWALGLLLVCTVPAYAEAQPAASTSQTDGAVVVQFRPPLGKLLQYQVTTTGKPGVHRLSLRFERSGDDFLMHASKEMPNGQGNGSFEAALAQPVTFTVDTQGKVTGIVDEDAYWRRVRASLKLSKGAVGSRAPARKYLETVRTMSVERRAAAASSDFRAILRGIGTHRSTKPSEDMASPLRTAVTVSGNKVEIVAEAGGTRGGTAKPDFSMSQSLSMTVDRSTGLLLHSSSESRISFRGKQKHDVTTIQVVPENS
jgi:hypothetical protein